jgi:hypothetical protein
MRFEMKRFISILFLIAVSLLACGKGSDDTSTGFKVTASSGLTPITNNTSTKSYNITFTLGAGSYSYNGTAYAIIYDDGTNTGIAASENPNSTTEFKLIMHFPVSPIPLIATSLVHGIATIKVTIYGSVYTNKDNDTTINISTTDNILYTIAVPIIRLQKESGTSGNSEEDLSIASISAIKIPY